MLGFLIALGAGFLVPHAEDPLARPLVKAVSGRITIEDKEVRVLSFLILLIVTGALASIFDSGSALGVGIGMGLGYFATRIIAVVQDMLANGKSGD